MKILILANNDIGLYKFRREIIQELLKQNTVVISCPYGELIKPFKEMGCKFIDTPVDRRGVNPKTDLKLYFMYRNMLKSEKPELVITYTIKPNVYGGYVCSKNNITYVTNITGLGTAFQNDNLLKKLAVFLYKKGLKKAKTVFFENPGDRDTFIYENIVSTSKTQVLNGAGVNIENYQVSEYPDGGTTKFLFMGRVMREKGIDELFETMRRLVKEGYDAELDVLGVYEEDYKTLIEKYESEGWLHYHGYQKDVKPFIEKSHCFVLPSWHEGMANTNLECASMGRPVITSKIHGCMEAVADGTSGFLCEKQNSESLYETMKKFINLSYEERKAMGLAGRKRMEEIFDKKSVVDETIKHLFD